MTFIPLLLLALPVHASIGPACDARVAVSAREAEATRVATPPAEIDVKYVDEGVTTATARENWTSAKVTLGRRGRLESIIYLVSARQLEASADCQIVSMLLMETRESFVDRRADALRLAGPRPPDGPWRALEAIDRVIPFLGKPWPRAGVELIEGDAAAAIDQPITLKYSLGWGECEETCAAERTVTVRYVGGPTAPLIQIIDERGAALP